MAKPEEELERALEAIIAEARAHVAAGREPNTAGLDERMRTAARRARSIGADPTAVAQAEARVRRRLEQIASVHRARTLLAREAVLKPAAPLPRRPLALRAKPTITGNLHVRR